MAEGHQRLLMGCRGGLIYIYIYISKLGAGGAGVGGRAPGPVPLDPPLDMRDLDPAVT